MNCFCLCPRASFFVAVFFSEFCRGHVSVANLGNSVAGSIPDSIERNTAALGDELMIMINHNDVDV